MTKTPFGWKASGQPAGIRGKASAFTSAWKAGVFRGRLNELMTLPTYLHLVEPYLPEQSSQPTRITLTGEPAMRAKEKKTVAGVQAVLDLQAALVTAEGWLQGRDWSVKKSPSKAIDRALATVKFDLEEGLQAAREIVLAWQREAQEAASGAVVLTGGEKETVRPADRKDAEVETARCERLMEQIDDVVSALETD
jgi:hypothetical protein